MIHLNVKIITVHTRNLKPSSQKNIHLTSKATRPNSNRPKTRQQKRKRKSNWGRRKRRSDGLMVMERVVLERKRIVYPSHNNCLFIIFFLKIIVTLEYQCSIYYFFPIIIPLFIEFHPT